MKINNFYTYIIFLISSFVSFAQPGDTDGTPTDNLEGTDPAAGINSLLLITAFFGIIFAIHTFRKNNKVA